MAAVIGCPEPNERNTTQDQAAIDAALSEWRSAGRTLGSCSRSDLTVTRPDWLMFTQLCGGEPAGDVREGRVPVNGCVSMGSVVIPRAHPEPLRLIVHETLHWAHTCRYGTPDTRHSDRAVWEGKPKNPDSIEGRAKAKL